jgi:hypothetical protein
VVASAQTGSPRSSSFTVHVQTLRDFARELDQQIEALSVTRETAATLAQQQGGRGAFAEADLLLSRHTGAVDDLRALLAGVQRAIRFAEDVTHTAASSYEQADAAAAEIYIGGSGAGSAGRSGASGVTEVV